MNKSGMTRGSRSLSVQRNALESNEVIAGRNKAAFGKAFVVNFLSSPGSGKTSLLEAVIPVLKADGFKVAVIEGDVETDLDGKTIGVCSACTYEFYLDGTLNIPGNYDFVIDNPQIKTYDTDSSAVQDLALGDGVRLDAAMSSLLVLKEAKESGTPIKIVGDPLYYEPLAAAIDKKAPSDPQPAAERRPSQDSSSGAPCRAT